ncbi:response regulator transcription factor [Phormidium sp. FACHB-592]|uniref:Response regulator transcription factor n=2 Tax=Cyanobacteriota TaxID=1117 RepID=A0ABV0KFJ0_9CYAN|nr:MULTISPECIES: response regulator transcription factor [Cyanophyceae]MBD2039071.1 response regulator transcription factor [Leptolyngbya sp. FACHB-321]MBD2076598.1 response regulator transcription factor [Phormidium sp. FACHB-592]
MIRVLLVEDQEIVRRGLKTLLEIKPDLQVAGEAGNGQQAIAQLAVLHAQEQMPDVILMDLHMPVMDGVTATRIICQQYSGAKILVFTTFDDVKYVAEALRWGAKGYLLKDTPSEELAEVIRSIHRGYTQFGPGILEKMIAAGPTIAVDQQLDIPPGLTNLTLRERQVLRMVAVGASNREIAQALFLSEGTVRNHISHILTRLGLRDRTQAAIVANAFLHWLDVPDSPKS